MTIPAPDFTTFNGPIDWLFHSFDTQLFGHVGIMLGFLIITIFIILMLHNPNRFTAFGFLGSLLLALGIYGYTIVGWIAILGAMLIGLLMGIALIFTFRI